MKNKGLIITLIILLTISVVLLIFFLVSCLTGKINFKNGFIHFNSKSTNVILSKEFEKEDIKSIDIKQDAGDIIFEKTEKDYFKVLCYGDDINDVKLELINGKLNIDYKHKENNNFFNFKSTSNDIIVYIPSNYSNDIKIKNNCGDCDIPDLENASVNIDCDAGDVEIGKIKNANVQCDYGNIKINEVLNKCDIKANCGNIEVNKIAIKENSSIKADLGNVDINDINDIYIDANVDLGKTIINKNNKSAEITLKIDCDCGNVTVGR